MLTLPSDLITAKNKLSGGGVFVELLEIQMSELSTTIRLANNNDDVIWGGLTWQKFNFEPGDFNESQEGETNTIDIRVSNIGRVVQGYIEQTVNGLVNDTAIYRLVHVDYDSEDAAIEETFTILSVVCDEQWAAFTLGMENFYMRRFPLHVFQRNLCRYDVFKGTACGYSGAVASCDRRFETCITIGNQARFGGQPAIPNGIWNV